jgi:hypothetical protein
MKLFKVTIDDISGDQEVDISDAMQLQVEIDGNRFCLAESDGDLEIRHSGSTSYKELLISPVSSNVIEIRLQKRDRILRGLNE